MRRTFWPPLSLDLWLTTLAQVTRLAELPADAAGAGGLEADHLLLCLAERRLKRDRGPILRRGLPANPEEAWLHRRIDQLRDESTLRSIRELSTLAPFFSCCVAVSAT